MKAVSETPPAEVSNSKTDRRLSTNKVLHKSDRNFDLLINYPGDTESNLTDYDLIYGKRETLVAELDGAVCTGFS